MDDVWRGALIGFPFGIVASIAAAYCWELRDRARVKDAAEQLEGTWTAYNFNGRDIEKTPMPGAGETVVTSKEGRFSSRSGVLDVQSKDIDVQTGRPRYHSGHIVIDRILPWTATRIDRYDDEHEVSEQRIVRGTDPDVLYMFPNDSVSSSKYGRHAWRRTKAARGSSS